MVPLSQLAEMSPQRPCGDLADGLTPHAAARPPQAIGPQRAITPIELAGSRQARNPAVGTSESPHEGEADIGLSYSRCPQRARSPWRFTTSVGRSKTGRLS